MALVDLRETGFDWVFGSQILFRRLLEATTHPGTVISAGTVPLAVPPDRLRLACATLLAILDPGVSLHVLGPDAGEIGEYLCFNTGARPADPEQADFVLVTGPASDGQISRVKRGTLADPHEGATIVYAPEALAASFEDPCVSLFLTGPGVKGEARLVITGIAPEELDRLRTLVDFPLGVDIWFASADCCLAVIPRSSRWRREG